MYHYLTEGQLINSLTSNYISNFTYKNDMEILYALIIILFHYENLLIYLTLY